jgi:hypothetical protein
MKVQSSSTGHSLILLPSILCPRFTLHFLEVLSLFVKAASIVPKYSRLPKLILSLDIYSVS